MNSDFTMKGWCCVLCFSLPLVGCCDSPSDFRFLHKDKFIPHHFEYFDGKDKLECTFYCLMSNRPCQAFAVDSGNGSCYLYDMYLTSADNSTELVNMATYVLPSGNIALYKPTAQNDVYDNYTSNFGVDGSIDEYMHTHDSPLNWWCVDLQRVFTIRNVSVINRPDLHIQDRIDWFEMRSSEVGPCSEAGYNSSVPCYKDGGVTRAVYYIIECNNSGETTEIVGRYIFISLDTGKNLHFSELEVYV